MMIVDIRAHTLRIPFRDGVAHASLTRRMTQTILVEIRDADGQAGYGEGCPQECITRENLRSALDFVRTVTPHWRAAISDIESLRHWAATHESLIDAHPAAWCAVEMALLDLFGKRARMPIESVLGLPRLQGTFVYSAVLGDASPRRFDEELRLHRASGCAAFSVRLSGDAARDAMKIDSLRESGVTPERVRADADNLWPHSAPALRHLRDLAFPFCAIEEPVRPHDVDGMQKIAAALDCDIIVNASVLRVAQLDALPPDGRWVVNVRLSTMGGILRSLALVSAAASRGLGVVIGAYAGETSLLTRAALTVATAARPTLFAQEGAWGARQLTRDVVTQSISFGTGGTLIAGTLGAAPGLGLTFCDCATAPCAMTSNVG